MLPHCVQILRYSLQLLPVSENDLPLRLTIVARGPPVLPQCLMRGLQFLGSRAQRRTICAKLFAIGFCRLAVSGGMVGLQLLQISLHGFTLGRKRIPLFAQRGPIRLDLLARIG